MNTYILKDPIINVTSCSIRLSPLGILHLDGIDQKSIAPLKKLLETFERDWREGWFILASEKFLFLDDHTIKYWKDIASYYLSSLCHLPPESEFSPLKPPENNQLSDWILNVPPMMGGEYLTIDRMIGLWNHLNTWIGHVSLKNGGIHTFLSKWAPQWRQVGRVCFHLAENKKSIDLPFAFLATYSTGFGSEGKLRHLPLKIALQQYSGDNNRAALINLLTPVQTASEKCLWVNDLISSGELYQPVAWSANKAYKFLNSVPQLEESGLSIRIPNWWKQRPRPQVSVTIDSSNKKLSASALLDFKVELTLGDDQLTEEEIAQLLKNDQGLAYLRGQWVEVDTKRLQEAITHWKMVQKQQNEGKISFIEGMRLLAGLPAKLEDAPFQEEQRHWINITTSQALGETLKKLRDPTLISNQPVKGLTVSLRPYQQEGVNWLSLLSGLGLGACLADDMGLGKTIQILSLLQQVQNTKLSEKSTPSLLIIPASLLGNWQRESQRFTPSLKFLLLHPSEMKSRTFSEIENSLDNFFNDIDYVVTTYSMIVKMQWLSKVSWNLLILDEAQAIKNAGTKQARAIKLLKSQSRIALTGTPIENRLFDLWSLFDFLNPGLLGSSKRFSEYIKNSGQSGQYESLRKLIAPYMLRRMKTDPRIITELPNKIETTTFCTLSKQQARQYQAVVQGLLKSLENISPKERRGAVLKVLLELKQICNHPSHYAGCGEYHPSQSGKFERLQQICEELAAKQERVLIFTQFSTIIEPLEQHLCQIFGRKGLILHGGTSIKERKNLVEDFQREDGPPFFVLSLKAGGTGLTLTAASHVIHFDRWWNPAVENQATDRAFRIGQKKNVQVHKFVTQGTIEEKIDAIISSKKKLATEILSPTDEISITELSDDELLNLLTLDIDRATII